MHWTLIIFEMTAPYVVGLSLLPLIVKARVQHAYAHLKKHEDPPSPVPEPPQPAKSKKKKSKVVQQPEEKQVVVKKPQEAPLEFIGSMEQGIAYVQMMTIILITCSAIFVWWTKHEVIFPQRSAPKFVFDFARAMLVVPYAIFWS